MKLDTRSKNLGFIEFFCLRQFFIRTELATFNYIEFK